MSGILLLGDWIDSTAAHSHHANPQHCAPAVGVAHTVKCLLPPAWRGAGLPQGTFRVPEIYLFAFSIGRFEKLRKLSKAAV